MKVHWVPLSRMADRYYRVTIYDLSDWGLARRLVDNKPKGATLWWHVLAPVADLLTVYDSGGFEQYRENPQLFVHEVLLPAHKLALEERVKRHLPRERNAKKRRRAQKAPGAPGKNAP